MRSLADFYATRPGSYWLPRAAIDHPQPQGLVFPDVEQCQPAFERGKCEQDIAGPNFLT